MMNKTLLIFSLFFATAFSLKAQISLVGAATSPEGGIDILKWQALDSTSVETHSTFLDGYYLASSVYDAYNGNYYISGISGDSSGLFSFNTRTNTQSMLPFSSFSNITEIDMSTGKIYNLFMYEADYISVNEYDISTGTDSLLGVIYEPGVNGIFVDAIGFNSNDGILYYLGIDSVPQLCIYSIYVREEGFLFDKVALDVSGQEGNISSLNYDNVNESLYAIRSDYDPVSGTSGLFIVEIDPLTGDIDSRGEIEGFMGYVAGSSSFDQLSSSFMISGIDTNYMGKMIIYNTLDDTYITGFVPGNVSEIACDNSAFALANYILTGQPEHSPAAFRIYPNPASSKVYISVFTDELLEAEVQLIGMDGIVLLRKAFNDTQLTLHLSALPEGVYFLRILSGQTIETKKLIISR